jgi:succinate-semialdehyde dehydrogenase/glutarate-semialdehyde dehydrogenase
LADAKGEAAYAASYLEWFSEEAPRIYGDTIPSSVPGNRVVTVKEPVGVCGLITPYVFYERTSVYIIALIILTDGISLPR